MWRRAASALCFGITALGTASAAEYEAGEGRVRSTDGSEVIWENVHRRGDRDRPEGRPGRLTAPVAVGEVVFYAIDNQLYAVSAADGAVQHRVPLPAGVTGLRLEDAAVVVAVGGDSTGETWRREYRVDPERPHVPYFPCSRAEALSLRLAARRVLSDLLAAAGGLRGADPDAAAWRRSEAARPWLERGLAELERLAAWDPTNPWYDFQRGLDLHALGRTEEARALFESVLETDEPWSDELLGMALDLDAIDPALGERAFERGLAFRIRRGYDPGMAHGLIAVLLHYGRPEDTPHSAEGLERLAGRMWRLAPAVEGAAYFYAAVAEALEAEGQQSRADVWRERAAAALPEVGFLPGGRAAERAGVALNGFGAAMLAFALTLLVKGLRYLPTQRRAGRAVWNPLALWTRGEVLGLLALLGLLFYSSAVTVRGLATVGRGAALAIPVVSGNYGHPLAIEHLATLGETPGASFVHALALQKAGRPGEARALYERLDDPRAANNLGVLLHTEGRTAEARALFESAADAAPGLTEAALNAGREADPTPRLATLARYGAAGPWLALPSDAQWDDALGGSVSLLEGFGGFFDAFQTIGVIAVAGPALADAFGPEAIGLGLTLLVAALALAALFVRPGVSLVSSRVSRVGWGLGLAVPGTARQLGAAGPLLLWAAAYSWLVDRTLALSDGVASNLLAAIATPDLERAFGVSTPIHTPLEQAVRGTSEWWWILALVNAVAVLALERWRPDPCGPWGAGPD